MSKKLSGKLAVRFSLGQGNVKEPGEQVSLSEEQVAGLSEEQLAGLFEQDEKGAKSEPVESVKSEGKKVATGDAHKDALLNRGK